MKLPKSNFFRKMTLAVPFLTLALLFSYTNCTSKMSSGTNTSSSTAAGQSMSEEEQLMEVLTKASNWSAQLGAYSDSATVLIRGSLDTRRNHITNLIKVQRLAINDPILIREVDLLIVAIGEAQYRLLQLDVGRVERESKERDRELQAQIDDLRQELDRFKAQVNARFATVEQRISNLESRSELLERLINDYRAASISADLALKAALEDLKKYTDTQIVDLRNINNELKAKIIEQKILLDQLFVSNSVAANLNNRLCTMNNTGVINDTRAQCSGSEANLYSTAQCCLTVDAVNCNVLFPSEVQGGARSQCSVLVATIRNHSQQLAAIREVDDEQTNLIGKLLDDVSSLNNQVAILTNGYAAIASVIDGIVGKLNQLDQRLLIVEFKASRGEAVSAILERADLNLAWIARRQADVNSRYCRRNVQDAVNKFDYEAARQNWEYCNEKLEFLTRAHELTQLAKAYANGLASINVESSCGAIINGVTAENLSVQQMMQPSIFQAIQDKCTTGGQIVAKAMMFNVVALLNSVGPDFRTVNYMNKKAKIAQLIFFGKNISETSTAEKQGFENVDPTDANISKTLYGRVERAFKTQYVEGRMRTISGTYPESASSFPEFVADFDEAYSLAEINSAANPYLARLKSLEAPGACVECGFKVVSRTSFTRDGKQRFQFPKDSQSLCPVINDVVILKAADGKHYPFNLSYDYFTEVLQPRLDGANHHTAVAADDAVITNGEFSVTGRSADFIISRNIGGIAQLKSRRILTITKPWGTAFAGRGACLHYDLAAVMKDQEYVVPSEFANDPAYFMRYLSGFTASAVTAKAAQIGGNAFGVNINLSAPELSSILVYKGAVDQASLNLRALSNNNVTQLGSTYWMTRTTIGYAADSILVSPQKPFYGTPDSHGDKLVRAYEQLSGTVNKQDFRLPASLAGN